MMLRGAPRLSGACASSSQGICPDDSPRGSLGMLGDSRRPCLWEAAAPRRPSSALHWAVSVWAVWPVPLTTSTPRVHRGGERNPHVVPRLLKEKWRTWAKKQGGRGRVGEQGLVLEPSSVLILDNLNSSVPQFPPSRR